MRFKTLDAFRGLAILWVMARHFMHPLKTYPFPIQQITDYGYLGVQVFLVISGFGISCALFQSKNLSAWDFFKARFFRVLPPYWASLLFAVLMIPGIQTGLSLIMGRQTDFFFHLSFWDWLRVITVNYFLPVTYPDWYLAVILQIYAAVSLMLLTRDVKKIFWVMTLLSWIFVFAVTPQKDRPLCLLFYWPYFSVGFILHEFIGWMGKRTLSPLHWIPAILTAIWFGFMPNGLVFSLFLGTLLWPVYLCDETISRWPWVKALIFLGGFSYSIYLMHVPLRGLLKMSIGDRIPVPENLFVPFIEFPMIIVISYFWAGFFEKKLPDWLLRRSPRSNR